MGKSEMARYVFMLNIVRSAMFFISTLAMAGLSEACDSDVFIHEVWGEEQTVEISGETWTIRHRAGDLVEYYSASIGTGIPYRALMPISGNGTAYPHRMISDLLVIDMEVYRPRCSDE